jgi:hypothetical protein
VNEARSSNLAAAVENGFAAAGPAQKKACVTFLPCAIRDFERLQAHPQAGFSTSVGISANAGDCRKAPNLVILEQFQEKCDRFSVRNCVKTKT